MANGVYSIEMAVVEFGAVPEGWGGSGDGSGDGADGGRRWWWWWWRGEGGGLVVGMMRMREVWGRGLGKVLGIVEHRGGCGRGLGGGRGWAGWVVVVGVVVLGGLV